MPLIRPVLLGVAAIFPLNVCAAAGALLIPVERFYLELTPGDQRLIQTEVDKLLIKGKAGSAASWKNDASGNYGTLRLERTFHMDLMPCRMIRHIIRLKDEQDPRILDLTYCRENGRWRLAD